jgi:RNA polymerase sigma-70 factor (ECF subfamily)
MRRAPQDGADLQGTRGDASEVVVAKDDAADLQSSLARLPALQREVVALAYFGELSHTEIATRLRLPPGPVKGRMRLGIQKLRADNTRQPAD